MKNKHLFFSLLATGLAGATFAILNSAIFPITLRADKLFAVAYSIGLLLFALRDYTRRPRMIRLKLAVTPLLRPIYPVMIDARKNPSRVADHRSACSFHSAA